MAEPSATSVSAPPAEVAERSDERQPRGLQTLQIDLRITTVASARHMCGLLLQFLDEHGHQVDGLDVRKGEPLAGYIREARG